MRRMTAAVLVGIPFLLLQGMMIEPMAPTTIDIMVVYTPQARQGAGGAAAMEAFIDLAIADTNTAFTNGLVNQQFRLVYAGEVTYSDSGDMVRDLNRLTNLSDGYLDEVHTLRDQYGADLVSLYVQSGQYGGIAWIGPSASYGFSVCKRNTPAWVLSHETGHNMGCMHDRANSGQQGAYPYSFGYSFRGNSGIALKKAIGSM